MRKKLFDRIILPTISFVLLNSFCYAWQYRLTKHRLYLNTNSDGAGKIYYLKHESGDYFDLYRMNEDGTGVLRITNDNMVENLYGRVAITSDKTKLAVIKTSDDYDYIYTMNSDGTNQKMIYSTTNRIGDLKISPDNSKIAFVEFDPITSPSSGTLCIINFDGTNPTTLSPHRSVALGSAGIKISGVQSFAISGSTMTQQKVETRGNTISFSPDSSQIVFVDKDGYLSKINVDGTSMVQITTFTVESPYWLKSNKIMFNTYTHQDILATINPDGSGYTTIYSTTDFFSSFSVSPDESKIAFYLNDHYFYILIISTSGTVIGQIPMDASYGYLSWVSNTKIVYTDIKDIFTANANGTEIKNLTNNDLEAWYYVKDAKGSKIIFIGTSGKIYSMNTDGTNKTTLLSLTTGQSLSGLSLSPDGSKVLYSISEGGIYYLYSRNSDGSGQTTEISRSNGYYSFSWSPDGSKIMFSSGSVYNISNPDGTGRKQLTFPEFSYISSPIFSPDGTKVMFLGYKQNDSNRCKVCIAPIDVSTYTIILSTTVGYSIKDWKANKVLLMRETFLGPNYSLYSMNSDGSDLKLLDTINAWYSEETSKMELSPDGLRVVYFETGGDKCYIINTDGTGKVKLSDSSYGEFAWSSDSSKIAYINKVRGSFPKIYLANSDGSNAYNLNPSIFWGYTPYFVLDNKIVYSGDGDIWIGDYAPTMDVPVDVVVPQQQGEVKVVVPEGGGEKGTINPDSGKPVSIGFKGSSSGKFTLRIFTQFGEEIYKEEKDVSTAEGWFSWIPGNLASGVYLVSVEGPGVKIFKKIPILR